ncbi:MAG: flagellar basal-body MS-ring/collar protein FliF [Thermacetogeniaceae bacterium]
MKNDPNSAIIDKLLSYIQNIPGFFNSFDKNKKTLFISGLAFILLVITVLTVFVTNPRYTPLYTNLDTQDAASIAQYLKDKKIPYQIADEGNTILVPDAQKYQVRLDLANNNLPKGNIVGFETFDQNHFGETESEQKIRYNVALQGELERTIGKIDGVADVRVHIVSPDQSLFVQDNKDATASVLLKLKPGYSLQDSQVLGVARLVASGVEGLKPENVSIIDATGNILSDNLGTGAKIALSSDQLKIKQDYDNQLQSSIQSMLERVAGPGKVIVRANTALNFDQVEINDQTYGDKQVRNDHTIQETDTNAAQQGAPGTSSNIPSYQQVNGQNNNQTQKVDKTTNYEINTQTEHRIVAPGQIKQISLSVILDQDNLDPQQQKQIEEMVIAAAGVNTARGDKITVAAMKFNNDLAVQTAAQMNADNIHRELFTALYAILGFILILLVLSYLNKAIQAWRAPVYTGPGAITDLLASTQPTTAAETNMEELKKNKDQVIEKLRKLVRNNPDETVEVLRSWLASE